MLYYLLGFGRIFYGEELSCQLPSQLPIGNSAVFQRGGRRNTTTAGMLREQLEDKDDASMLDVCEKLADEDDAGMLNMCEQLEDKDELCGQVVCGGAHGRDQRI